MINNKYLTFYFTAIMLISIISFIFIAKDNNVYDDNKTS